MFPPMRLAIYLVIALNLISCHQAKNQNAAISPTELQSGCFGFSGDGKTITLQITETGRHVKGNLNYLILGKEPIEGNFEGTIEEDILLGTYTYRMGGMESERSIAFQVNESGLLEGHGILNADGSSFQNPHYLSFASSKKLTPCDCPSKEMDGKDLAHFYSQVKFTLVDPIQDGITLHNMANKVTEDQEKPAFLIFNKDQSRAEIFFHSQRNSLILNKIHEGSWSNSKYTLSFWKGFTLYHETTPIFLSDRKVEKEKGEIATAEVFNVK